ncbi:MAG: hypothetical protein WBA57_27705 [Elainellaceae cyanobacterium]
MSQNYAGSSSFANAVIFLKSAMSFADREDTQSEEHRIVWRGSQEEGFKIRLVINKTKFIRDVRREFVSRFSEENFSNARDNLGALSNKRQEDDNARGRSKFLDILTWSRGEPPKPGRRKTELLLTFPTELQSLEEIQRLDWLAQLWNEAREARDLPPIDCYRQLYSIMWYFRD